MIVNQAAFDVARLASTLSDNYCSQCAAFEIARTPIADTLLPPVLPGQNVPIGIIKNMDGSEHKFHFEHFLKLARANEESFTRTAMTGMLIALGDALYDNDYFDNAPELEMIYHLRNGVAHGNKFNITGSGIKRLAKYPANNFQAEYYNSSSTKFEITPALNGNKVLFDYIFAGDVLLMVLSARQYLQRIAFGYPLRGPVT